MKRMGVPRLSDLEFGFWIDRLTERVAEKYLAHVIYVRRAVIGKTIKYPDG